MDCLLPDVLAAFAGEPPPDARMLVPPPALVAAPSPRAGGKGVYGEDLAHHVDGLNFTVQWEDPNVDEARARAILAELEDAWTVLVTDGGWPAPVSSDAWLLWVILDPELGGSGYTTVYPTDAYPDGYPVTYLNPDYEAENPAFGLSVAVHELGHMLQYRLRDTSGGRSDSWYWEATSEWVAEHAAPGLDTYAESTYWYAQWPDARFDRFERYHPYGMVVLDAYLDERVFGMDGIRDTWMAGQGRDTAWDQLIAERAGEDFPTLIADMAAELAAGTLREASLYDAPLRAASHDEAPAWAILDGPERYGTHYVDIGGGGEALVVEGDVRVGYATPGAIHDTPPEGAYTLVLTALSDEVDVAYGVTPPTEPPPDEDPVTCACGTSSSPHWPAVALGLGLARRRRAPGSRRSRCVDAGPTRDVGGSLPGTRPLL